MIKIFMNKSSNQLITDAISEQYGASIQMLENIVKNCGEELWSDSNREIIISQVVYHVLFYIDFYLSKNKKERENFTPKLGPDQMGERTDGLKWDKIFTKEELLDYITDLKRKAKKRFTDLKLEELTIDSVFEWHGSSVLSSFMYNLRHIMLHVGALHVRLNVTGIEPQKWVSKAPF
ncbi:MAG: hypothetical protein HeimC3_29300 [Candidatus Heimdallarchaeota archaeon LC_3]|nr:MAG: hypothetical protein HeimC3_29300 [Candidatus Heimdallarchaeota archaeon LC_3]